MIKAVLFDLDGTLVNTIVDLGAAVDHVLKGFGISSDYTEADYKQMVGNGAMVLLERAFHGVGRALTPTQKEAAYVSFIEIYSRVLFAHTAPYEGITELLRCLRQSGRRLAVITNKPDANARQMADHLFLPGLFDFIAGQRVGVPIKPDPAQVHLALNRFNVSKENAVYIGDSNTDIQTARNAGLVSIGVDWGFRGAAELRREGADYIAYHPSEIQTILRKL